MLCVVLKQKKLLLKASCICKKHTKRLASEIISSALSLKGYETMPRNVLVSG